MKLKTPVGATLIMVLWVGLLLLSGCATPPDSPIAPKGVDTSASEGSLPSVDLPSLTGEATVELMVNGSPIVIKVDGANAPITAGNFVDLVQRGVYDGLMFHRVVRQPSPFVVQGGDPQSANPDVPVAQLGTGGFIDPDTATTRYIPLEIKPSEAAEPVYSRTLPEAGISEPPALRHSRGAVAMARSQFPDSASSQFYITLTDLDFLDGSYAVFGYVTSGMEAVDQIQQGDRIESARVISGAETLQNGG